MSTVAIINKHTNTIYPSLIYRNFQGLTIVRMGLSIPREPRNLDAGIHFSSSFGLDPPISSILSDLS